MREERKLKVLRSSICLILIVLLFFGIGRYQDIVAFGKNDATAIKNGTVSEDSTFEVHFIDVGQGDSTLIICNGEAMLIDAEDNSKSTTVQLYLKKHNVDKLKYVIGTHPDADHIGGLDVILYKYDCETVIMPDIASDTATYRDVIDTLKYKNMKITYPKLNDVYKLGEAYFTIIGPQKTYEDDNNNSVAIRLVYGEHSFLFVGDAQTEAEMDMIASKTELRAEVLKVGHHGSSTSTSQAFLSAVKPEYAVISYGENNSYGHPHQSTLNRLKKQKCQILTSGMVMAAQGNSELIVYNAKDYAKLDTRNTISTVTQETIVVVTQETTQPATQKVIQTQLETEAPTQPVSTFSYVLNTNTKKFHYPTCKSVKSMKDKNKKMSDQSRDVIIGMGYSPCKNCNP